MIWPITALSILVSYGSDGDYKIDDSGLQANPLTANKKVTIKIREVGRDLDWWPAPYHWRRHLPPFSRGRAQVTIMHPLFLTSRVELVWKTSMKVSLTPSLVLSSRWLHQRLPAKEFSFYAPGGGVSSHVEPANILEKTPIMILKISERSDQSNGFGPFKVKSITPGESVGSLNAMTTTTKASLN